MEPERLAGAAAFAVAAAAAGWAAFACRRAHHRGEAGADARAWELVAALFLALAAARVAHAGPWLGAGARDLARAIGLYEGRRPYQIVVTVALAGVAIGAAAVGVRTIRDRLRRYRLATAAVAVVLASALIRFVSLHEVDAWDEARPWMRAALEVGTSAAAAAAGVARARQVRKTATT